MLKADGQIKSMCEMFFERTTDFHRNYYNRYWHVICGPRKQTTLNKNPMKTIRTYWLTLLGIFGGGLVFVATALTAWSQTAPILTITSFGTNQFSITITNGDISANYELYRTPVLVDPNYPWTLEIEGLVGQTNFTVDMGSDPSGFFRAGVGVDADGDGVPNYMDGDPNNPSVGALTITIDSPLAGTVFN